jgi:hypothetical protein
LPRYAAFAYLRPSLGATFIFRVVGGEGRVMGRGRKQLTGRGISQKSVLPECCFARTPFPAQTQADTKTFFDVSDFSEVDQSVAFDVDRGRWLDGHGCHGWRLVLFHA